MSRFSIPSAVAAACVCGAVASAGVIGTYAVLAPLVAGENLSTSQVQVYADGHVVVRLRANENGILVPASSGTVTLVQDGAVTQEAPMGIGLDGTVQIDGVQAGPYSIFVGGGDGFAAFGAWLDPAAAEVGEAGAIIDVGLVPAGDMPVVEQIIQDHLGNSPVPVAQFPVAGEPASAVTPTAMPGPLSHRELIGGYGFELDANGVAHGRVVLSAPPSDPLVPIAGLSVYFVRSGQIVSSLQTDADGLFHISDLSPGVYSLVVAGPDSFLALAADVHPAAAAAAGGPPLTVLPLGAPPAIGPNAELSAFDGETPITYVSPVFASDLPYLLEQAPLDNPVEGLPLAGPPPCCGPGGGGIGGGGGFGGGGGGGAYGGSGLGALLGLGAIGIAAAALANDDDNDPVQVMSPSSP